MRRVNLEVTKYDGPGQWQWTLTDDAGTFVADHEVDIGQSGWQWQAFTRLNQYLGQHIDKYRPLATEAEIIAELGEWISENAFGSIGQALVDLAPVTAGLRFPAEAEQLMFRPWELAVVAGLPLARQERQPRHDSGRDQAAPR